MLAPQMEILPSWQSCLVDPLVVLKHAGFPRKYWRVPPGGATRSSLELYSTSPQWRYLVASGRWLESQRISLVAPGRFQGAAGGFLSKLGRAWCAQGNQSLSPPRFCRADPGNMPLELKWNAWLPGNDAWQMVWWFRKLLAIPGHM